MPTLNIKDAEVRALAKELAQATHQTMTEAVKAALREKLERECARDEARRQRTLRRVAEITRSVSALPVLDTRSEDEILGYDENGLFK